MADKKVSPIVKKSNILCRASWSPDSVWEARLIAIVASKIRRNDKDFQTYEIPIGDVLIDVKRGSQTYEIIDKVTDYSMTKLIKIPNPEEEGSFAKYNLFSKCLYSSKKGTITVRFDPDLKPHYLNLQGYFAEYDLTQFLLLPSTYSQRVFEFLKSWDDKPEVIVDLSELHTMLNAPPSLKSTYKDFKRRVLEKAHKDITKHTSFRYEWGPIKKGRKVIAIKFTFSVPRAKKVAEKQTAEKRQRTQKENNRLAIAAMRCWKKHDEICATENSKTQKVCEVCKDFFPRPEPHM